MEMMSVSQKGIAMVTMSVSQKGVAMATLCGWRRKWQETGKNEERGPRGEGRWIS